MGSDKNWIWGYTDGEKNKPCWFRLESTYPNIECIKEGNAKQVCPLDLDPPGECPFATPYPSADTERKLGNEYEVVSFNSQSDWASEYFWPTWNDIMRISKYLEGMPGEDAAGMVTNVSGLYDLPLKVYKELLLLEMRLNKLNIALTKEMTNNLTKEAAEDEQDQRDAILAEGLRKTDEYLKTHPNLLVKKEEG